MTIIFDRHKAFDTVNHSISLSKLSYHGIQNSHINIGLNHTLVKESKEFL